MAKQPRKEVTSLRLEPKIKYLAEIASRVQRRNLTNYIEWVIEDSLKHVELEPNVSVYQKSLTLWSVNDGERLVRLAMQYPDLLTYDEQVQWRLINQCDNLFWNSFPDRKLQHLDLNTLEKYWDLLSNIKNNPDNIRKIQAEELKATPNIPF